MRRLLFSYPVRLAVVLGAIGITGTIIAIRRTAGLWSRRTSPTF